MKALTIPSRHPILRQYLQDVIAWHGYIRFVGMVSLQSNPDIPFEDLYVGQSVSQWHIKVESAPDEKQLLNPAQLLAEKKRLLVLGDPGMGKTTLINYFAWFLSSGLLQKLPGELNDKLPVPLVLRDLDLSNINCFDDIIDAFLKRPVAQHLKDQRELLFAYLNAGNALLLIDGLDEVGSKLRKKLINLLLQGFEQYPQCYFLCTSRIIGYEEAPLSQRAFALAELDSEQIAECAEQAPEQALEQTVESQTTETPSEFEPTLCYMAPMNDEQIARFAHHWYREQGAPAGAGLLKDAFVKAINADDSTKALARTPNLLTMMALVFKVRSQLPNGRALLYEDITQAYLESIDAARGLKDPIPWKKKKIWLARVGFEMQMQRGGLDDELDDDSKELLISGETVLQWIEQAMENTGDTHDRKYAAQYLDWIARRSGLLLPKGENQFAFMHLSFQEYFAAVYIKHQLQNPAWLDSEEDDDESTLDSRVTKAGFGDWVRRPFWHQALIFLFELFDGQPGWTKRLWRYCGLIECGVNWFDLIESAPLKICLLANPHSGLTTSFRDTEVKRIVNMKLANSCNQEMDSVDGFINSLTSILSFLPLQLVTFRSIEEFKHKSKIAHLNLNGLRAENTEYVVEKLLSMLGLTSLNLAGSNLESVEPILSQTQLEFLNLCMTPIKNISPLKNLPNLQEITIDDNPEIITDGVDPAIIKRVKWLTRD